MSLFSDALGAAARVGKDALDKTAAHVKEVQAAKAEQKENEQIILDEVERLPLFRGTRGNSSWRAYAFTVTPKSAEEAIRRAHDAINRVDLVVTPLDFHDAWEEAIYYMNGLASIEKKLKLRGEKPSSILRRWKINYIPYAYAYLDRYADWHQRTVVAPMKSKKGKKTRSSQFLSGLDDIWGNLPECCKRRAEELSAIESAMIDLPQE